MLRLENISKSYQIGKEQVNIFTNLTITFPDVGMIGIYGESGCGKSTLLNIISSLEKPDQGKILYNEKELSDDYLRNDVSIMYQNSDLISFLNVKENIMMSSIIKGNEFDKNEYHHILKKLGIANLTDKYPHQLSMGQQKRVSIGRMLLKDASILLADEPTGSLHQESAHEVMRLLKEEAKTKLVIIVSHDLTLLQLYCDSLLHIDQGQIEGKINPTSVQTRNPQEVKKRSLLFYTIRQFLDQLLKFMILILFEIIIITSSFLLLTGLQGINYTIEESETHAPIRNILTIENYDSSEFEELIDLEDAYCEYKSLLELGQLNIDCSYAYLPNQTDHIQLEEGRFPSQSNEVLITSSLNNKLEEDKITYTINEQVYELEVVGIIKEDFFKENYLYFSNSFKEEIGDYVTHQIIVIESENYAQLYKTLEEDYMVSSDVYERTLSYQSLLTIAYIVLGIFFIISVICSLFLLYMIYATIADHRKYDYGLLFMMGISKKRLFTMTIAESAMLGLVIGISGCLSSHLTYYFINNIYQLSTHYYFSLMLSKYIISRYDIYIIIILFYLLITMLSSYFPIKKISATNYVSILREE